MTDLKGTLANIARAIVDNPDEVTVIAAEETENSVTLKLSVAPSDMGKVIGKHGKNADSRRFPERHRRALRDMKQRFFYFLRCRFSH